MARLEVFAQRAVLSLFKSFLQTGRSLSSFDLQKKKPLSCCQRVLQINSDFSSLFLRGDTSADRILSDEGWRGTLR